MLAPAGSADSCSSTHSYCTVGHPHPKPICLLLPPPPPTEANNPFISLSSKTPHPSTHPVLAWGCPPAVLQGRIPFGLARQQAAARLLQQQATQHPQQARPQPRAQQRPQQQAGPGPGPAPQQQGQESGGGPCHRCCRHHQHQGAQQQREAPKQGPKQGATRQQQGPQPCRAPALATARGRAFCRRAVHTAATTARPQQQQAARGRPRPRTRQRQRPGQQADDGRQQAGRRQQQIRQRRRRRLGAAAATAWGSSRAHGL